MTKIALILSGQPRSFRTGYEYHKRNLLDHYDVDVFGHTWKNENFNHFDEMKQLYQFKTPLMATEIMPDYMKNGITEKFQRIPNPQFPAVNTFCMFLSMWLAYETPLSNYGIDWNEYDVIIRSRYDYALNTRIHFEEMVEPDKIYVPSDRMTAKHDFCADMFAFGSPHVMSHYFETYLSIYKLYDAGVMFIGEDILAAQLKRNNLVGNNMVYVDMNNPFPPGKYNGNWHSLIRDDFQKWNDGRE